MSKMAGLTSSSYRAGIAAIKLGDGRSRSSSLVSTAVVRHAVASQKTLPPRGIHIGFGAPAIGTHYLSIEIHKMSVVCSCTTLDAVRGMTH